MNNFLPAPSGLAVRFKVTRNGSELVRGGENFPLLAFTALRAMGGISTSVSYMDLIPVICINGQVQTVNDFLEDNEAVEYEIVPLDGEPHNFLL